MGTQDDPDLPGPRRRRRRCASADGQPDLPDLPGSPCLPFVERMQQKHSPMARVMNWLGLVAALICLARQALHPSPDPLPYTGRLHLWLFACACATRIFWRSAAGRHPIWALLRMLALLHGAWLLQRQVAGTAPSGSTSLQAVEGGGLLAALWSGERRAALFLAACTCLPMLELNLSSPLYLGISAAAQATFTLYCLELAPLMCTASRLAAPTGRSLTRWLARMLSPASLLSLHPLGLAPRAGDGAAECCAVLRFWQLTLGLLGPVAWQAASQAVLFERHQQQRHAAGLPPECGFVADLHGLIHGMLHPAVRPHLCVGGLLALGLCWSVAVGSAAGS